MTSNIDLLGNANTTTTAIPNTELFATPRRSRAVTYIGKGNGFCRRCHSAYQTVELNEAHHCRHCADELNETHQMNEGR